MVKISHSSLATLKNTQSGFRKQFLQQNTAPLGPKASPADDKTAFGLDNERPPLTLSLLTSSHGPAIAVAVVVAVSVCVSVSVSVSVSVAVVVCSSVAVVRVRSV